MTWVFSRSVGEAWTAEPWPGPQQPEPRGAANRSCLAKDLAGSPAPVRAGRGTYWSRWTVTAQPSKAPASVRCQFGEVSSRFHKVDFQWRPLGSAQSRLYSVLCRGLELHLLRAPCLPAFRFQGTASRSIYLRSKRFPPRSPGRGRKTTNLGSRRPARSQEAWLGSPWAAVPPLQWEPASDSSTAGPTV